MLFTFIKKVQLQILLLVVEYNYIIFLLKDNYNNQFKYIIILYTGILIQEDAEGSKFVVAEENESARR